MKPKLILCLALVLIGGLFGCSTTTKSSGQKSIYPLSLTEIEQIDQALPKLKTGMTGDQVVAILGPAFKGISFRSASGPTHDYRFIYDLRPGYNLMLVYDLTSDPPRFIRYQKAGDNWTKP